MKLENGTPWKSTSTEAFGLGGKPRLFYNITEDVKARKANAFENFPAFDLIAFIVVVFYERNSDNGLICIPIVYKPFEIG